MVQGVHSIKTFPYSGNKLALESLMGKEIQGATESTTWKYRILTLEKETLGSSGAVSVV